MTVVHKCACAGGGGVTELLIGACPACGGPIRYVNHGVLELHTAACPVRMLEIARAVSESSRAFLRWKQ